MFGISFTTTPVFIMDKEGNISNAREGSLVYQPEESEDGNYIRSGSEIFGNVLNFIERDGFYAYSEFFSEGDWPDKYFYDEHDEETGLPIIDPNNEDAHLPGMYNGIRLIMVSGGWCEKLSDLIQTIPDHPFYEMIDVLEEAESVGIDTRTRVDE
jgi:hypothetical protein